MKKLYLSYNNITNEYCLDGGIYGRNRSILKLRDNKMLPALKKELNLKRKTELYVSEEIEKHIISGLENILENSKIKMKVVKDLREY
jgi:hypothetical protein